MSIQVAEKVADVFQYAVPVIAGVLTFTAGNWASAGCFATAGLIHQVGFSQLKKTLGRAFPEYDVRPKGGNGAIISTHTSAVAMGAGFSLLTRGLTPISIGLVAMACLTGLSRYYTGHHGSGHIAAGAVVGLGFAGAAVAAASALKF